MPDREMTPERAIIILDQLNTDGRIEVDRGELRAAIRTARAALRKQIPINPIRLQWKTYRNCPACFARIDSPCYKRCSKCGQALDWGE